MYLNLQTNAILFISADFSPSTIWDNDLYIYMRKVTGNPEYYTHNFVYKLNPCAKLIVMMRDPAERLFVYSLHSHREFEEII